jgi:hypothetical protein
VILLGAELVRGQAERRVVHEHGVEIQRSAVGGVIDLASAR